MVWGGGFEGGRESAVAISFVVDTVDRLDQGVNTVCCCKSDPAAATSVSMSLAWSPFRRHLTSRCHTIPWPVDSILAFCHVLSFSPVRRTLARPTQNATHKFEAARHETTHPFPEKRVWADERHVSATNCRGDGFQPVLSLGEAVAHR